MVFTVLPKIRATSALERDLNSGAAMAFRACSSAEDVDFQRLRTGLFLIAAVSFPPYGRKSRRVARESRKPRINSADGLKCSLGFPRRTHDLRPPRTVNMGFASAASRRREAWLPKHKGRHDTDHTALISHRMFECVLEFLNLESLIVYCNCSSTPSNQPYEFLHHRAEIVRLKLPLVLS